MWVVNHLSESHAPWLVQSRRLMPSLKWFNHHAGKLAQLVWWFTWFSSACQWDKPSYLICRSCFRSPSDTQTWLVGNPPQIGSHENWWHRRLTICLFPSYSVGLYIPMTSLFVVRLSPTNHHIPYRIALQHLRWEVPTEFGQSPPEVATLVVWWRTLFSHHHFWYNMMQNEHWWTLHIWDLFYNY